MAKRNGVRSTGRRVAIVAGLRTPFVKSGTVYKDLTTLDLANAVVSELIARTGVEPDDIDQLVYGQVVPSTTTPNIAREIVLGIGLPHPIEAYSVVRACATSTQSIVNAAQAILLGDADVAIAGGADSLSQPPITYSDNFVKALVAANNARDTLGKLKAFSAIKPKDLLPKAPALREFSTGLTMGESAEVMAKENGISRAAQDAFAVGSHRKAAEAWEKGIFGAEVIHYQLPPDYSETIAKDTLIRPDTSVEKIEKLRPVFDRRYGTVTAANSSPLTDGAAAVLLMEEKKAKDLGFEPLAYIKSWAFAALDPGWQLLMGPSFATPKALEKAGMTLADIDIIDMHEAFASQMLSNVQAFGSKEWARKHLGRDAAIGEIDEDNLNIYGGSISIGHPFAATGARQAMTMANELNRRGGGTALCTQCAAGGLGAALILER